jgi:catechol 2,3-dioxygenase-like lactoylglutathione lyase family enzyme
MTLPVAQRLALIALVVPDYDEAIGFYVGRLGFRLTSDEDQGEGRRWVTVAPPGDTLGCQILLARAATPAQTAAIGNQTGGRVFLILQTNDFDRDHTAMLSAGVRFEEAPRHEPYGTVAVWQDPFGNRWDLIQFAGPAAR